MLQISFTLLYVLPFYLSPTTRPSPTLSRDAPSVIRARIRFVTISVTFCSAVTLYIISTYARASPLEALRLLGWYPISVSEIANVLILTALLFAGPLFLSGVVESRWRDWIRGDSLHESLSSWIGWRNFVAVFSSLSLLPGAGYTRLAECIFHCPPAHTFIRRAP